MIFFLEIDWGPGPPMPSGYTDGHRVEMYVSITNTEGVMTILMLQCALLCDMVNVNNCLTSDVNNY